MRAMPQMSMSVVSGGAQLSGGAEQLSMAMPGCVDGCAGCHLFDRACQDRTWQHSSRCFHSARLMQKLPVQAV